MRKKSYKRMLKKIHEINDSPLSFPLIIRRLKPLSEQKNYNPKLREWFGPKEYETVAETSGIFESFKKSEEWHEIGTLSVHDIKCSINNDIPIRHDYSVIRADTGEEYEVIFIRPYIGENVIGLRPLVK